MKREASERLDRWLKQSDRKPLVIRGARQTGKTWIVRDLAARHNRQLVEINFERTPELKSYFIEKDPAKILKNLSAELARPIRPEDSLLFLDEIQAAPEVFACLRWFKEEMPELPVISAGSLLDFVLAKHTFSMPVGRISYFYLEPMSFLEFVRASGNDPLYDTLKTVAFSDPLNEALHHKCMELYRTYCICGGMPEVVNKWISSGDMNECMSVQIDLLTTYLDDFNKYGRNQDMLQKTLRSVAEQLGNKFVMNRVDQTVRSYEIKNALSLLAMARVISTVHHSAGNGIPLGAETNDKFLKAFLVDTGLVSAQLGLAKMKPAEIQNVVFSNKGGLAEQFTAQQIRYALSTDDDPELYYWQRTAGRQGEIDYLLQARGTVLPVEVKGGSKGSMKSLHQFMYDKKLPRAVRFDTNNLSSSNLALKTTTGQPVQYTLLSIPIYLAERILELAEYQNYLL